MATTARELFAIAGEYAESAPSGVESAEMAITALGHVGRALDRVLDSDAEPVAPMLQQLATACWSAASTWPPRAGRLPDLVGAAADLIGRELEWGGDARWDAVVELARTARRCTDVALRHEPFSHVPVLRWVHATAVRIEQQAAERPPRREHGEVLDRPVPSSDPAAARCQVERRIVEAAAQVLHAVRQERHEGGLSVDGALAIAAVAEHGSQLCVEHRAAATNSDGVGRHAREAWQIVYAALIRFHDASRGPGRVPSECVRSALQLQQEFDRGDSPTRTVARTVQLLARELEDSVLQWGWPHSVFARARDLMRSDAMVPAVLADATVPDGQVELAPVTRAIGVARRLSTALATDRAGSECDVQWVDRLAPLVRESPPIQQRL